VEGNAATVNYCFQLLRQLHHPTFRNDFDEIAAHQAAWGVGSSITVAAVALGIRVTQPPFTTQQHVSSAAACSRVMISGTRR